MANKRLLSLLFLISITNLFLTNAKVTRCYHGTIMNGGKPHSTTTCPEKANYACSEINQYIYAKYGCASESDCEQSGVKCCLNDNCNYNRSL